MKSWRLLCKIFGHIVYYEIKKNKRVVYTNRKGKVTCMRVGCGYKVSLEKDRFSLTEAILKK